MSLTAPGCGMSDVLKADVEKKLARLPEVKEVKVDVVFDPPWTPARMSEAAKLQLGFDLDYGMNSDSLRSRFRFCASPLCKSQSRLVPRSGLDRLDVEHFIGRCGSRWLRRGGVLRRWNAGRRRGCRGGVLQRARAR